MEINEKIVTYSASLSRRRIEESEIGPLSEELNGILGYMRTVNDSVDTEGVQENAADGLVNVMREDAVAVSFDRAELLENCPEHTDSTPVVPKTVD